MKNIHRVASNYSSRPEDQKFESLQDLHDACLAYSIGSHEIDNVVLVPDVISGFKPTLVLRDENTGEPYEPTHGVFQKVCQEYGAPPAFLSRLTPDVAAMALRQARRLTLGDSTPRPRSLLVSGSAANVSSVRSITSDRYVRIWDYEVARLLLDFQSANPDWGFPTPFRKADGNTGTGLRVWGTPEQHRPTPTAFASDSEMFVFLCNYNGIEVNGSYLTRGLIVENSEVGMGALRITKFLFDFMCSNCIIWGAQEVVDVSLRHVGSVRDALLATGEVMRIANHQAQESAEGDISRIKAAQRALLGSNRAEVISNIYARRNNLLTKKILDAAYTVAESTPRYGSPNSVWGMVNGITEVSQLSSNTAQRVALDQAASSLLGGV